MKRVYSRVIWFFEQLLSIMIGALALVVIGGVFFRYVLSDSLPWTDEVSGYMLVWVTFLGSVTALERGKHINFDAIMMALPKRPRRFLEIVADLFLFAFLGVLLVSGYQITTQLMNQTAVSFEMPMGLIYSIMPISGFLMMVVLVYRWFVPRDFATGEVDIVEATE